MPNPWDKPPWPDTGENGPEPIYLAVGRALSRWADVEEEISELFVFFVGPAANDSPAVRAYISIDGVRNRIEMVRHAADAWFDKFPNCGLKLQTTNALNACHEWASRRNEIAHGIADLPVDTFGATWFLYPGYFTKKRRTHRNNADFRYNAEQIHALAAGFESLEVMLRGLSQSLEDWREVTADVRQP